MVASVGGTAEGRKWCQEEGNTVVDRKVAIIDMTGGPWVQDVEVKTKTTLAERKLSVTLDAPAP